MAKPGKAVVKLYQLKIGKCMTCLDIAHMYNLSKSQDWTSRSSAHWDGMVRAPLSHVTAASANVCSAYNTPGALLRGSPRKIPS